MFTKVGIQVVVQNNEIVDVHVLVASPLGVVGIPVLDYLMIFTDDFLEAIEIIDAVAKAVNETGKHIEARNNFKYDDKSLRVLAKALNRVV